MLTAFNYFWDNLTGFMAWNLFLAFIPFALSIPLFSRRATRNILWWLGLIIFTLFLPNAAYVITDIIHFVSDVRDPEISPNGIIFVIIPQYLIFIIAGFQCHVLSLLRLVNYLRIKDGITKIIGIELGVNLLCAYGIYLGRFDRLNSWHILTKPGRLVNTVVDSFMKSNFWLAMFIFFVTITLLYYIFKWINLSLGAWWKRAQAQ
jgi:uncharacterized membrane protein